MSQARSAPQAGGEGWALVVGASPELKAAELSDWLESASLIIAADSGAASVLEAGGEPDLVIGDLDSLSRAGIPRGRIEQLRLERRPRDKDETDLELALLAAAERSEPDTPIIVFGALGGRIDQHQANLALAFLPALEGRPLCFQHGQQRAWPLSAGFGLEIRGKAGDLVSLLPMSDDALFARSSGLRWPLDGLRLRFGPARGVSNRMEADRAIVELSEGRALCVHIPGDSPIL